MALELTSATPEYIDPFNGLADLAAKILRTPNTAENSFSDDPLRMMRAARFASQLQFAISPDGLTAMKAMGLSVDSWGKGSMETRNAYTELLA